MSTPASVALVGLRGAGKSSVGRALAALLGRPFVDQDEELARRAGAPGAGELLARLGEPAFRDAEARLLPELLAPGSAALVLATGGGAVLRAESRDVLRARATVVWLRAAPEVLAARLAADDTVRPPLRAPADDGPHDAASELASLAREREDAYRAAAHVTIDAAVGDVSEIARTIASSLGLSP